VRATEDSAAIAAIVGCGSAEATTRIEIVDPATALPSRDSEVGEIWIAGRSVARGYWRRPEETRTSFRAYLAGTLEGPFLRTGDLGFLQEGELFVTGRIKDVMIVRGLKHDPHDVELTVEAAAPNVRPGAVAAFTLDVETEAVAIAAEVEARDADSRVQSAMVENIRAAVAATHGIQLSTIVLLALGALPKTTSGKIQRYACREGVRAGSLPTVARWDVSGAAWPLERTA
jgi:acyl-CoA synthetase (AMP-forming)/AMP-acid ligase II